jgi:hypothetical protein
MGADERRRGGSSQEAKPWWGDVEVRDGKEAILMEVVAVSLGVLLHGHYFWGNVVWHSNWVELGKIVSLVAFIGALVTLVFRLMWL